ncbi:MAG: diaminopimelate epimerase [Candidatus Omnitrophica bacterium]|nr:diaminopimelate epimerase [Candidatus Omnitrophota bacterium]MCM8831525.1 diaminopimelate epimerase [Candidatus Omnitrophota bacterium]
MEKIINFTKMVASGNDFILITLADARGYNLAKLAKKICDRKFGIGADGLLLIGEEKNIFRMRIFNSDGSEAQMCGNGARCAAYFLSEKFKIKNLKIKTDAGVIEADVNKNKVKIKLTQPKHLKLDIPIKVNNRLLKVNFINTGVGHTIIFVEGLEKIDVFNLGRLIRYHKYFKTEGTNVDFVEIVCDNFIKLRTYERGVEDETLACGTGAVAASIITSYKLDVKPKYFKVLTKGGEILKVYFKKEEDKIYDVWLEGLVAIVCRGGFYA